MLPPPRDSGHKPILITFNSNTIKNQAIYARNHNRADWKAYGARKVWEDLPEELTTIEATLQDLHDRINTAADDTIRRITGIFFPKLWWSRDSQRTYKCRETKPWWRKDLQRTRALHAFRRLKSQENFTK